VLLHANAVAGDRAQQPTADLNKASNSAVARKQAIETIPIDQLSPAARTKVRWVLENTSLFRRLPLRVIICDAELYSFAAQHPDVVVNIWEVLGVSHIVMRQTGPEAYQVNDDIGTTGTFEYLYRSRDTQIAYIDGKYGGKIFGQHVRGRGIIILKSGFVRDIEGRCYISSRLDAFMNIEPGSAEFLTKTFQPMVGKVADSNFVQTADFLGSLSRTAEVNLRGMQRLTARLDKVQPEVREHFAQVVERVAQRANKSQQAAADRGDQEATGSPNLQDPLVARREKLADPAPVSPEAPLPPPTP
jgi:hypothetical protein